MSERLKDRNHVAYHQGLETLGLCFGATTTRATDQGAPDVIWSFAGDFHLAFEAKTEKGKDSKLSKSDLQEARGIRSGFVRTSATILKRQKLKQ